MSEPAVPHVEVAADAGKLKADASAGLPLVGADCRPDRGAANPAQLLAGAAPTTRLPGWLGVGPWPAARHDRVTRHGVGLGGRPVAARCWRLWMV